MANNYEQIIEVVNKGNQMGLSNTIKRNNGIPLDFTSVQEDYEAALDYAQNNPIAYIGQPISVGDVLYVVTDADNGYLKAVGTKTTGDEKSISVAEDGTVSIYGFTAAANATLPRKNTSTGLIEWVSIDTIVQGDGNTKSVVVAEEGSAITVTPSYSEDTDTYTYTLDVTIPPVPAYSVTSEVGEGITTYKLTKDGAAVGEAIVVPEAYDDTALDGRIAAVEDTLNTPDTGLVDRVEKMEVFWSTTEDPDEVINTLKEIQDYIAQDQSGAESMLQSISANTSAINAIKDGTTVDSFKDVEDNYATKTALTQAQSTLTEAINAAKQSANEYTDSAVASKVGSATIAHTTESTSEGATVTGGVLNIVIDAYTKGETEQKISDMIADINGGESAGEVLSQLNAYKTSNDARVLAIETEQDTQDAQILANTNAIALLNKTDGTVGSVKKTVDDAVKALADGAVQANTTKIDAVDKKVDNANNNITTINGQISTLQQKDTNLESAITAESAARETLAQTVAEHTTKITQLTDKDTELAVLIQANTTKFADYSTTTQMNQAISQAIAGIDNSSLTEAIDANTEAIEAEVSRAKAAEQANTTLINTLIGSDSGKSARAIATEEVAKIVDSAPESFDTLKEIADWIANDETGAAAMSTAIASNTAAIAVLNGVGEGSVDKKIQDAIAEIPSIGIATAEQTGVVKASNEVKVAADGAMSIGSVSTDKLTQGTNTLILNGGSATTE